MKHVTSAARSMRGLIMVVVALIGVAIIVNTTAATAQPPAVTSPTTTVSIETANADQLDFNIRFAPFSVDAAGEVTLDGLTATLARPGAPALPYYSTLIALPPGASARVDVFPTGTAVSNVHTVQPAPQPDLDALSDAQTAVLDDPEGGSVAALPATVTPDAAIYAADALYPDTAVVVSEPMYIRDLRVVELKLFPLRYNAARAQMESVNAMRVSIHFDGADLSAGTQTPLSDTAAAYASDILNFDDAQNWATLPASVSNTEATQLPLGRDVYKIVVEEDGIYEVTGAELSAAGMPIASINPATIQMLYRGEPVAYEFVDNNGNGKLNSQDAIRFFGWAFDGSRFEKMYVGDENVFWLWAGGTAVRVTERANQAGQGYPVASSFRTSTTADPELSPFPAWRIDWDASPNDPDNFHMGFFTAAANTVGTASYDVAVLDPAPGGQDIDLTAEFTPRLNPTAGTAFTYTIDGTLNNSATSGQVSWLGWQNVNMEQSFPASVLLQPGDAGYPDNALNLELSADIPTLAEVYINRITVEYDRRLKAVDDQLIFTADAGGNREFRVSGFSEGNTNNVVVWDITDPLMPVAVKMRAQDITGSGSLTYRIGGNVGNNGRFIATDLGNVKSAAAISQYRPESIDPANGKGAWLAITHPDFMDAANDLAAYRTQTGLTTHVVNVEDVVAQYGYGFNIPGAIHDYVQYAIGNWNIGPEYLLLFGDATINPRQLSCEVKCSTIWNTSAETYVVTNLSFRDRFQGLIPSDFEYTLLSGDDLFPDIAIGRIPASTASNANNMVQKIILYEDQRANNPQPWQNNILFVADDPDNGGNFCVENEKSRPFIPDPYAQTHLCLEEPTAPATNALRAEMSNYVNGTGVSLLNYRGHGAIDEWASTSNSPALLSTANTDFWLNQGKPTIIISADCLDGYFGWPGVNALGETFMRDVGQRGTAAHWSSSGLGYTFEHSFLQQGFYEAIFDNNLVRIGDAVNYAKISYEQAGQHESELYGFTLLADPAMKVIPQGLTAGPNGLYLPAVLKAN